MKETTWGHLILGDPVNLEIDTLARYVAGLKVMQDT
jgi:riboflavin synthase alpha subunit